MTEYSHYGAAPAQSEVRAAARESVPCTSYAAVIFSALREQA